MVRRGDMMSANDVIDILALNLIGIIPDDESVVIAANQGEPIVGNHSLAGRAYQDICLRIIGKEVPFMEFDKGISFWTKVSGIFSKK
jgi:septum site-determining protein MinD